MMNRKIFGYDQNTTKLWRILAIALVFVLAALSVTGGLLMSVFERTQAQTTTQQQVAQQETVVVEQEEQAAVALTRTSTLIEAQSDGTTKFITTDQNSDGTSFRRVITNSNKTNLAADMRETFVILEIIPDYTFTYFSWLIGGCEPVSEDMMIYLANCGSGDVDSVFGRDDSMTAGLYAVTRTSNGDRLLELEDYSGYDPEGGKATNGWLRVKDSSISASESGYFKYVGDGKGLYSLYNFQTEYRAVAEGMGRYTPNISSYTDDPTVSGNRYTSYDYDLYYEGEFGNTAWPQMYAYSASMTELGKYAQYFVSTQIGDKTVELPYYEYVGAWNGEGTDPYAGIRCMPNFTVSRQTHYNGVQIDNNQYIYHLNTDDVTYNPGNGSYKAYLDYDEDGNLYRLTESGNYDCVIVSVSSNTGNINEASLVGTNEDSSSYSGDYVWVGFTEEEAASMTYALMSDYTEHKETTNIYLKNYTRTYAYYTRNGYVNNEFFKILCLDVADMLDQNKNDGENYYAITAEENSAHLQSSLDDFDSQYRIEIRCVSPDQVTDADLESASLIYAGEDTPYDGGAAGQGGLSQLWCDREGLTQHGAYIRDLPEFSMAIKIYENAIVSAGLPIPFMYSASLAQTGEADRLGLESNLYKLFMLFNVFREPENMRQFIPRLRTDSSVEGVVNYIDESTGNLMVHYRDGVEQNNLIWRTPAEVTDYTWSSRASWADEVKEYKYFYMWYDPGNYYKMEGQPYAINERIFEGSVDNIEDGDHSLMYHWYTRGFVMSESSGVKIYKLLSGWSHKMTVTITNAVRDANGRKIIYVDEFDGAYPVEFTVVSNSTVSNVRIYVDTNGNNIADATELVQTLAGGSLSTYATGYSTLAGNPIYRYELGSAFGAAESRNIIITAQNVDSITGRDNAQMIVRSIPNLN